jgi:hypothetical protein
VRKPVVLSGRKKHLVSIAHWTTARRAFGVEVYFKNHDKIVGTKFPRESISHEETAAWKISYGADSRKCRQSSSSCFAKSPALRSTSVRGSAIAELYYSSHSPRGFKFSPLQGQLVQQLR